MSTARTRTTMRWYPPTRTKPHISAATTDRPTQVSLLPGLPPSPDTAPGPTLVVTTDFPRRDPPLGPPHPETRNTSWTSGPPHSIQLTSPLRAGPFSLAVLQYPFLSWWRPLVAKCWNGRLLRPLGLAVGNTHPLVCPEGSWRPRSFLAVAP